MITVKNYLYLYKNISIDHARQFTDPLSCARTSCNVLAYTARRIKLGCIEGRNK